MATAGSKKCHGDSLIFGTSAAVRVARLALILAGLVAMFLTAMTIVYSIPQQRILANATASARQLETEGLYPRPMGTAGLQLDNYTDALMIDTSIRDDSRSALQSALLAIHQDTGRPRRAIVGLQTTTSGPRTRPIEYSYYWHGYQVLLRPALFLLDYGSIRYLNMLLMSVALLCCLAIVDRTLNTSGVVALVVSLAVTGFYVVPLSLQYSGVVYLMLAGVGATLWAEKRGLIGVLGAEILFTLGAVTAFVDLLTAPLLTLGMPLVALMLFEARHRVLCWKRAAIVTVLASGSWASSYAMTLAAKWLIGGAVLGHTILRPAIAEIALRTGAASVRAYPVLSAIFQNVRFLLPLLRTNADRTLHGGMPTVLFVVSVPTILGGVLLACVLLRREPRARCRSGAPVLIACGLPLAWIAVVSEHSLVHSWFTYRILAVSLFAILGILIGSLEKPVRN